MVVLLRYELRSTQNPALAALVNKQFRIERLLAINCYSGNPTQMTNGFLLLSFFPECPRSSDRMERFACPTPDARARYRCIDDRSLCDGFFDCPNKEDENPGQCLFYKTVGSTQYTIVVLSCYILFPHIVNGVYGTVTFDQQFQENPVIRADTTKRLKKLLFLQVLQDKLEWNERV